MELRLPLFERFPTGLRLTAASGLLLSAAANWTRHFDRVQTQMIDLRGLRRGHVVVAVIDALSKDSVPKIVREAPAEFPGVSFTLKVLDNVDVGRVLAQGDVDFGIVLAPQSSRDLMVRAHLDVVLGFATLPDPIAARPRQRFSACAPYPIVAPHEPLARRQQVRALKAATAMPLNIAAA